MNKEQLIADLHLYKGLSLDFHKTLKAFKENNLAYLLYN